ncbi:2Fe-2S iron-sulfur cluster protein [Arthrobacter sp. AG258]|uniref:(2Fe-2S)-binding protein n=1 Tax=Arthrobacter sp. AG258 TaxID=2183899 RepID=UPI0010DC14EB|nr:(2Fe-2S)-binding protein [Arthrobacter sp. AG258]TDT82134.1 2Fe-2S iron-sulfur cluster protein [Arthrobacter sp. AG258]
MSLHALGEIGSTGGPEAVRMSFDGRAIVAVPGQSVGAALVSTGITAWRGTRKESRPRGLFCGIGICFDCLVTVDGEPNQRACLVEVREGMEIQGSCAQDVDSPQESDRGQK